MLTPGTILMDTDALRPQCFELQESSFPGSWAPVKHNMSPSELEKELKTSGWTFFYMASRISAMSFGFDRSKMVHAALRRLIAEVKLHSCNCLEIDDMVTLSFLGIPYVSVSAHPRHIQTGRTFSRNRPEGSNGSGAEPR
jgi:hypothetical protein